MQTEPFIWEPGHRVEIGGQLGRIEATDRSYGYLVKMDAGHYVSAQRCDLRPAPLFDPAAIAKGSPLDPSASPTENFLRIVE